MLETLVQLQCEAGDLPLREAFITADVTTLAGFTALAGLGVAVSSSLACAAR